MTPGTPGIDRAVAGDLEDLVPLFEAYRAFYRRPPDPERARAFLEARLGAGESVVFLAREEGRGVGFVQLYPTFSSVRLGRVWILNDLYVAPGARGRGVARALMGRARAHAEESGALGLVLETAKGNRPAAALYRSLGWRRDETFDRWELALEPGDG